MPESECKIPTLIVLPDAAVLAAGEAAGEEPELEPVEAVGAPHDFNKILPARVEPKTINSRRPNEFVIVQSSDVLNQARAIEQSTKDWLCEGASRRDVAISSFSNISEILGLVFWQELY